MRLAFGAITKVATAGTSKPKSAFLLLQKFQGRRRVRPRMRLLPRLFFFGLVAAPLPFDDTDGAGNDACS